MNIPYTNNILKSSVPFSSRKMRPLNTNTLFKYPEQYVPMSLSQYIRSIRNPFIMKKRRAKMHMQGSSAATHYSILSIKPKQQGKLVKTRKQMTTDCSKMKVCGHSIQEVTISSIDWMESYLQWEQWTLHLMSSPVYTTSMTQSTRIYLQESLEPLEKQSTC